MVKQVEEYPIVRIPFGEPWLAHEDGYGKGNLQPPGKIPHDWLVNRADDATPVKAPCP